MPGRSFEVAIDANDPARLRRFWATALSYVEYTTPEGAVDLVDPEGRGPTIWFQQVPEGKFGESRTDCGALTCTNLVDLKAGLAEL